MNWRFDGGKLSLLATRLWSK